MRYQRLVFVTLICVMLIALPSFALSNSRVLVEEKSIAEYQQLISFFDDINEDDTKCDIQYPEYYAGAYLDDNGELIVLVTKDSPNISKDIINATSNKKIKIEKASVSLNELREEQYRIADRWMELYNDINNGNIIATEELKNLVYSFEGVGIDEENNIIVIDLNNKSKENLCAFKKYISDYPFIDVSSPVEYETNTFDEFSTNDYTSSSKGVNASVTLKAGAAK